MYIILLSYVDSYDASQGFSNDYSVKTKQFPEVRI